MKVVIGVDSSTTATKVIAFDRKGAAVAEASEGYEFSVPRDGWAEQNAEQWWSAFCSACIRLMHSPEMSGTRIEGLAITHQRFTFVPVDGSMQPLHPAILWNDLRCAEESDYARRIDPSSDIFAKTGYPPGQWTLYKALWLKKHRSEIYQKSWKLLLVADFLNYKLTGNLCTASGYATMTGALDIHNPTRWATDVVKKLDVRDDLWVDPVLPGGSFIGTVTRDAAELSGLPEGIPVFTAAGDQPCGSLGAGMVSTGQLAINGGTSCSNELLTTGLPRLDTPSFFVEIAPSGDYIVENDIPSGGSAVMNWYRQHFGLEDENRAEETGKEPWEVMYNRALEAPVGNNGFMIVPYLQGVYGPYWDQNVRGVALGLRADYGRPHLVRGLLEGVAYESKREVALMESATESGVEQIRMYGGSSRSPLWNKIFADIFGVPVVVSGTPETTALGAAIAAAVGSGFCSDYQSGVGEMTSVSGEVMPDPAAVEVYHRYYHDVYKHLFDSVVDLNRRIAAIDAGCENAT